MDIKTNDPFHPDTIGLFSGTFTDGSSVLPGVGNFPECGGMRPGNLLITKNNLKPEVYSVCDDKKLYFDRVSAKYYYAHENLRWLPVTRKIINRIPNLVSVVDPETGWTFYPARFNVSHNRTIYQSIGLYWIENGMTYYWLSNSTNANYMYNLEVLTCSQITRKDTSKDFQKTCGK